MSLVLNELSMLSTFADKYKAKEAYDLLIGNLKILFYKYDISPKNIMVLGLCTDYEVVTGMSIKSFLNNSMKDKEDMRIILMLLNNSSNNASEKVDLTIANEKAYGASFARDNDGVMLSLNSKELFGNCWVKCKDNGTVVDIRNICQEEHMMIHADNIVIRRYEPNPKHRTNDYIREGGTIVSPMRLPSNEAQKVLNKAKIIDGCLYGVRGKEIYEFRKTIGFIFHGFEITDTIQEPLKKKVLKAFLNED